MVVIILLGMFALVVIQGFIAARKRARMQKGWDAPPDTERIESPCSARFLTEAKELEKLGLTGPTGLRGGYTVKGDVPVTFPQDSHSCVFAPTGSGKDSDFLSPNIMSKSMDGTSIIVIDPKCESAPVTAEYRARLGPVYIINPHEMNMAFLKKFRMAHYNPMARLFDPKEPVLNRGPVTNKISDGCIYSDSADGKQNFWTASAKALWSGMMLAECKYSAPHLRNLPSLQRIVSSGQVLDYCKRMVAKGEP